METANATRPKFGEWYALNGRVVREGLNWHHSFTEPAPPERLANCMQACEGIANPSAIPALIEAARRRVTINAHHTIAEEMAHRELCKALAALDAEPVA